jgi:hypothetical protein
MDKRPFDNEVIRSKTVWSDIELLEELRLLKTAIDVLDKMGDRYTFVVDDLVRLMGVRDNMAIARKRSGRLSNE